MHLRPVTPEDEEERLCRLLGIYGASELVDETTLTPLNLEAALGKLSKPRSYYDLVCVSGAPVEVHYRGFMSEIAHVTFKYDRYHSEVVIAGFVDSLQQVWEWRFPQLHAQVRTDYKGRQFLGVSEREVGVDRHILITHKSIFPRTLLEIHVYGDPEQGQSSCKGYRLNRIPNIM